MIPADIRNVNNFTILSLFLKKINITINMLVNGIKICFYSIFLSNGIDSPLIFDFVKVTLIY